MRWWRSVCGRAARLLSLSRRVWQRADPAAPRSRSREARLQAVHRLQRSHGGPQLPDDDLRHGGVSRADAGRTSGSRRRRVRSRLAAEGPLWTDADGRAGATGARDHQARRSCRAALWRNAHPDSGVARNAVRVRAASRVRAVSRRGRGTAISAGSNDDAASPERPSGPRWDADRCGPVSTNHRHHDIARRCSYRACTRPASMSRGSSVWRVSCPAAALRSLRPTFRSSRISRSLQPSPTPSSRRPGGCGPTRASRPMARSE